MATSLWTASAGVGDEAVAHVTMDRQCSTGDVAMAHVTMSAAGCNQLWQ